MLRKKNIPFLHGLNSSYSHYLIYLLKFDVILVDVNNDAFIETTYLVIHFQLYWLILHELILAMTVNRCLMPDDIPRGHAVAAAWKG